MNLRNKNPFEYEGANNLPEGDIIEFYIEDYNFSRTINTKRNIFLIGERGSGKTMTLLYNSFKIQYRKSKLAKSEINFEKIGIYIPCNTPLFHKKEYELLDNYPFKASILGEHYLTLSLIFYTCETLELISEIQVEVEGIKDKLFSELEYTLGLNLKKDENFFKSIKLFIAKESFKTQQNINSFDSDGFYEGAYTFSSLAMPFFNVLKQIPRLVDSHFLLMIDDAHDLNKYQIRTINSWIAYRDHSLFSFKIATAKVTRPELITASGGSILEGHDFITIDMEKPFQNEYSDFYKLSKSIIERRLKNVGIPKNAEEYFPVNKEFEIDMKRAESDALNAAKEKYQSGTKKQIGDFVYKYKRAFYFRNRSPRANLPPYSGFQAIVDISTGVIRNLLDPCYHMYESELDKGKPEIEEIPSSTQTKIIMDRSTAMWNRLQDGLHKEIEGCSTKESKEIYNLFDQLMVLFDKRLKKHKSEPRAITFTISQKNINVEEYNYVVNLLRIAQKAQITYTRISTAKDDGKQEIYFVPNRLLFPSRGLDPHGQFARVSLKASDLFLSASRNEPIPFADDDNSVSLIQGDLFYG
jgi:hypothetical protein